MSAVQDPAAEITAIALQNVNMTRRAVQALALIAGLEETCPLASEIALDALKDLRTEAAS